MLNATITPVAGSAAAAYWLNRLSGSPDGARLVDAPDPSDLAVRMAVPVPISTLEAVRARARGSARAEFALVTAAVAAALERRTANRDVLFAFVPPGSSQDAVALPLRVGLDSSGSFKQHVLTVNAAIDDAVRHRDGVSDALELLGVDGAGASAVGHVTFNAARGADTTVIVAAGTHITWRDNGDSVSLEVFGPAARGETTPFARFAEHVLAILAAGVERPDARLDELPSMSASDAAQLDALNATQLDTTDPQDAAHVRVAKQARRTPDAVAVMDERRTLTYAALAAAAEAIASMLRQRRLGTEAMVGVLPPRDVRWVAALLGIWKAGCAYLPLDLVQASPRLAAMIRASRCAVLLAGHEDAAAVASILDHLPLAERPALVTLDDPADVPVDRTPREELPQVDPNQLAYVIFTSGSTGMPKGAMVEHRGMRNHLEAKVHALALGPGDVVAVTASASFDVSIWQLVAALLGGAAVYVGDDTMVRDPLAQLRTVDRAGITILEVVPSQLRAMLELVRVAGAPSLRTLRWLVVNGEPLGYDLCAAWRGAYPHVPLMNAYGPTECSDDVTHLTVDRWDAAGPVSIGRPLPNTRIYVTDGQSRPLPVGAPGEICVGGAGVGRGYLGDPARTAVSFLPDPFAGAAGARLYRTGDRGRWTHDGDVYCLGRIDHQVKLRGFRIELGEVETTLRSHADVRDAVAVVRDDMAGGPALVAYVVAREGQSAPADELRTFLRGRVPGYMIPSAFVALAALPLTPSGKVDRRALPPPAVHGRQGETPAVPPRTPIEHALSEIWGELLERSGFGIHDSFFDLGGHSLIATRVVARVRDRLGVDLPLQQIFSSPTIASLATVVGGLLVTRAGLDAETAGDFDASHEVREAGV